MTKAMTFSIFKILQNATNTNPGNILIIQISNSLHVSPPHVYHVVTLMGCKHISSFFIFFIKKQTWKKHRAHLSPSDFVNSSNYLGAICFRDVLYSLVPNSCKRLGKAIGCSQIIGIKLMIKLPKKINRKN